MSARRDLFLFSFLILFFGPSVVNSVVFFAILVMALGANLAPYYALLVVGPCLVVFVPVFFAGVIFAAAFRESRQPDVDFGWNVLLVALAYYLLSLPFGVRRYS
jgi:hypothetical protein